MQAQVAPTQQSLTPEKTVERQIAGGESHTYQITLTAGQFMHVVVELDCRSDDEVLREDVEAGQRPAAALRAAQVEMWKQKQWQSPYYWAAFTMQGEWR